MSLHTEAYYQNITGYVDDALIETLWHELDKQVPPEQIACVANEIAVTYQDATVKAFVPILIHRQALDHFRHLLKERTVQSQ